VKSKGPFSLKLAGTEQLLFDYAPAILSPQWWFNVWHYREGQRRPKLFEFDSVPDARAFLVATRKWYPGFDDQDIEIVRIVPPVAERYVVVCGAMKLRPERRK
jgi:hypothetical protein